MKRTSERTTHPLAVIFLITALAISLVGCSSGAGAGSGFDAETAVTSLSTQDLAVVEASLVADRLAAVQEAPVVSANLVANPLISGSILADVTAQATGFGRRGKQYRGGKGGSGQGGVAGRGTGTCIVGLDGTLASPTRLLVASQACQITKLADGSLQITLGSGNVMTLVPPTDGTNVTTITVNGIAWEATFGTSSSEPLVVLKNPISSRILTIEEADDGSLTVTPSGGRANRGRWASDGALELTDTGIGRGYRFRGGRME